MYEITCLDAYGNSINSFTQWDVDQKIVVTLEGCDENYLDIAPEVHFCNMKSEEALVVRSTVSNRNTISAFVPNSLLQEPYPLLAYVYLTDSVDVSSQKTILRAEIPVRKRAKPSDYLYVENIERITAEMIKKEIEADVKEIKIEAINTIQITKNDAIALIEQYEDQITETKNDAYDFITNTKDDAVDYIDNVKRETEAYISEEKARFENDVTALIEQYEDQITEAKSDAYDFITNIKDETVDYIDNVKRETEAYISEEKAQFETTAQGLIDDVEQIKADTQSLYEDTVSVADQTADKIESDIRTMMLENGMEIQITSDGNGICTASILVAQS